jgi:hypothetical protein
LTCEVEAWRKKARDRRQPVRSEEGQRQGHRRDYRRNVPLQRLTALQQALGDDIKTIKAAQKPAG